jgi:structural maintenance of chromosomes protein 5
MPLDVDVESRTRPLEDEDEIQEDQRNKRRRTDAERYASLHFKLTRFPPGSIIRVSLKNFVTYSSAEFFPGPNMNLVIGPNGSGKSTIVCAICLGLGYSPNVLGRATAAGDFVQNGKDMAEIEIELAQENGKSVVVKRKIKRDKNLSTYYLNGRHQRDCVYIRETRYSCQNTGTHGEFQHPN